MILLACSLILFFCSILIFFDLTFPILWKLTIAATEYGHLFFILPLLIAVSAGTETPIALFATIVSLLATAFLIAPTVCAIIFSRSEVTTLTEAFRTIMFNGTTKKPFRISLLWFGQEIPPVQKEIFSYASFGGVDLTLHFFRAHSTSPSPCIIVLHTGGWDSGSPAEFETMNRYLASQGYAVAAISYRLAPTFPWPAQREDTLAAIGYLKENADRLGIDPSCFVLFGRSAGGQIAEAVACTANDPSIKGCVGFYAPADLIFAYEHLDPEPDILDSRTLLHHYLGGPLGEKYNAYHDASSYHHVSASTPPILLVHGTKDPLTWYRQSERFAKKLSEHSVSNAYIEIPWGTHAFDYNFNGPGGQISRFCLEWFLLSVTQFRRR